MIYAIVFALNAWHFPWALPLEEEKDEIEVQGNCAEVKKAKTLKLKVRVRKLTASAAMSPGGSTFFGMTSSYRVHTARGAFEILAHEARRELVYEYANKEFLEPVEKAGKYALESGCICRASGEEAKKALQDYLEKLREKSRELYLEYVTREQGSIGAESVSSNWRLDGSKFDSMISTHQPNKPEKWHGIPTAK